VSADFGTLLEHLRSHQELTIIKQVASKMTSFGFPNDPRKANARLVTELSDRVQVWELGLMHIPDEEGPVPKVFALVINKGHVPVPAYHVVDFRIGNDIYSPSE